MIFVKSKINKSQADIVRKSLLIHNFIRRNNNCQNYYYLLLIIWRIGQQRGHVKHGHDQRFHCYHNHFRES